MRLGALRIRWSLRGPLLALILVLSAVVGIQLLLLAELGRKVNEGQTQLQTATAEQIEALEMEINAREQDMDLFRYLRTGDEVYLNQLADRWVDLNEMIYEHRTHVDPGSSDQHLADELVDLMSEAESRAGVLIMLRQHQLANLDTLRSSIEEIDRLLARVGAMEGASTGSLHDVMRQIELDLDDAMLAVSSYVAVPREDLRGRLERSLDSLRLEVEILADRQETHSEVTWIPQVVDELVKTDVLVRRIIATQLDQAQQFAEYAATLKTLSEDALGKGLRVPTATRQAQASNTLRATIDRTVLHGLLLGGIAALVALLGGMWLYRHAVSAHEYAQVFQNLIDHAPQGVLLHSPAGVVTYANPAALAMLGVRDPEQIVGRANLLLTEAKIGEPPARLFQRVSEGETVHREISIDLAEIPIPNAGTGTLHLLATLFPTADLRSSQPAAVQVLTNISERVRADEARAAAERAVEEQRSLTMRADRLRSLGEMAAGIAHELNQPLVGVRGLAEHILLAIDRGWAIDETMIREKIQLIVDQADRMEHIIEHVRMFAREAGKSKLTEVSVNDIVVSSLDMLGTQLRNSGIEIATELGDALPTVSANPFSLEEVIINLILNARDALQEHLHANPCLAPPHLTLSTSLKSGDDERPVQISVIDRGTGIAAAILDEVFNPFFTTKGPQRGTGLGLSIAKAIVEDFGGDIEIHSEEGRGTVVTVAMPAMRSSAGRVLSGASVET
jgi:C4-dicarboxylate-specific signal transduction histidine kinase